MAQREDKYLLIEYSPYSFVYSDRLTDDSDFFGFKVYDTFDRVVIPYPMGMKLQIKDRNKTHFNVDEVANVRLAGPMATVLFSWDGMHEVFAPEIAKLLDVSRLKTRLSFNSGQSYVEGELRTKIKQSRLTGYNETNLKKVEMAFQTPLDAFLFDSLFGGTLSESVVLGTESEEILGESPSIAFGV